MFTIKKLKIIKPSKYRITKFDSYLAIDSNNVYFYAANGIVKISINEKHNISSYHLFGDDFELFAQKPLIIDNHFYQYGTFQKESCIVKTDLNLNIIWRKYISDSIYYRQLVSETGKLYFSTSIDYNDVGKFRILGTDGNIILEYIENEGYINIEKGCDLLDDRVLIPVINRAQIIAYKIIDCNGNVLNTITTEPKDLDCFRENMVSILKDENRNVLIIARHPAKAPEFIPSVTCIVLSPYGDFLYREDKDMPLSPVILFIGGQNVICCFDKNILKDEGQLIELNLKTNKERSLIPIICYNENIKCILYKDFYFVFAHIDKLSLNTNILIFDKNFNLECKYSLNTDEFIMDVKIVNDYIFVLTTESLKIFNLEEMI